MCLSKNDVALEYPRRGTICLGSTFQLHNYHDFHEKCTKKMKCAALTTRKTQMSLVVEEIGYQHLRISGLSQQYGHQQTKVHQDLSSFWGEVHSYILP